MYDKYFASALDTNPIHRIFAMNFFNPLTFFIMAAPKVDVFGPFENEVADLAKALGHPARIAILKALAQRNSCVCGEIVDVLPLAQSTVSQHLKELKSAGLISGTVEGVKSCYCINWDVVARLKTLLDGLLTPGNNGCC